jgi:hypothetical protein
MDKQVARARAAWAPIVVDAPSETFEDKPPRSQRNPADTICDGWSTAQLRLRYASVRGRSHRFRGEPRQDHVEACWHEATGRVVFAVADGVSTAPASHRGALTACRVMVDCLLGELDHWFGPPEWSRHLEEVERRLDDLGERLRIEPAARPRALATTLVAGVLSPTASGLSGELVQIGDTSAWRLRDGVFEPLLAVKTSGDSGVVSNTVTTIPPVPGRPLRVSIRIDVGDVLLVGTDGVGDPLGAGTGLVGELLAAALAVPPPVLGFAHLLDFSRETFDDDRSLLAVWPRSVHD